MARNYNVMLEAAAELQDYTGFMSTETQKQMSRVRAHFDGARRRFVYERFHEGIEHATIWPSVSADLDRISEQRIIREDAIDYTREQLEKHIARQANNTPLKRFAVRWGPPTGAILLAIAYEVAKLKGIR
jgi:hypothetical protein